MQGEPDETQAIAVGLPMRTTGAAIGAFRTDLMTEALWMVPERMMQERLQETLLDCLVKYVKLQSESNQQGLIDQEIEIQTIENQLLEVSSLAQ